MRVCHISIARRYTYLRTHIRRFGKYGLDMEEMPDPLFPKPLPFKMPL